MKSPIAVDKAIIKEFDIPKDIELHPRQKIAFLDSQLQELKAAQWRARVDVMHATRLMESDTEALRIKGGNNIVDHKNQIKQFTGGILMIQQLLEEIRKENPTAGTPTATDQIEG